MLPVLSYLLLLVPASEKYMCNLGKFLFIELEGNRWISIVVSALKKIWRRLVPGNKWLGIGKIEVHAYALSALSARRLLTYPRHLQQPIAQSWTAFHSKDVCVFSTKNGNIWKYEILLTKKLSVRKVPRTQIRSSEQLLAARDHSSPHGRLECPGLTAFNAQHGRERHGDGMGTSCYVWVGLKFAFETARPKLLLKSFHCHI
jgi:hypothetical protein